MKPVSEYVSRWHSFADQVKPASKPVAVGASARAVVHSCIGSAGAQKLAAVAAPVMADFLKHIVTTDVRVELEQPMEAVSRSGYCPHCKILWVAEEPNYG
jgi:hypothetical protein